MTVEEKTREFAIYNIGDTIPCRIICPNCGSVENAEIEISMPFNIYIHYCSKCEYVIMESEWAKIK